MEFTVFLIPIIFIFISIFYFHKKVTWWELLLQVVVTIIVLSIMKLSYYKYNVSDTEYLGGVTKHAVYNEDWNQKVSCRHPIYCTRTVRSGKSTYTQSYVCGHHHPYDVDYHPATYNIESTLGDYSISPEKYHELKGRFNNEKFVELNRGYHTNDGDRYVTTWNGKFETIEPVSTSHSYDNRVQCSKNIFNYNDVSEDDIKIYKLFDYPDIKDLRQQCILPEKYSSKQLNLKINQINGMLGSNKQARLYIMIFEDQPQSTAFFQESLMVGGNKNEVLLMIGVNSQTREINWSKVTSWCENEEFKITIRDYVNEQNILTENAIDKILVYSYTEIYHKFKRKEFSDFNYLAVDISNTQMVWLFIIVLLINVGVFIFNIMNEFNNDHRTKFHY